MIELLGLFEVLAGQIGDKLIIEIKSEEIENRLIQLIKESDEVSKFVIYKFIARSKTTCES